MLLIIAYVILSHTGASAFWFFFVTVCWFISLAYKIFLYGVLYSDMQKEGKERTKVLTSLNELKEFVRFRIG